MSINLNQSQQPLHILAHAADMRGQATPNDLARLYALEACLHLQNTRIFAALEAIEKGSQIRGVTDSNTLRLFSSVNQLKRKANDRPHNGHKKMRVSS